MSTPSIEELALGERAFLHDLANHLVVAHGMSSFVLKAIKSEKPLEPKDVERLEKAIEAMNKISAQLKARRTVLMGASEVI